MRAVGLSSWKPLALSSSPQEPAGFRSIPHDPGHSGQESEGVEFKQSAPWSDLQWSNIAPAAVRHRVEKEGVHGARPTIEVAWSEPGPRIPGWRRGSIQLANAVRVPRPTIPQEVSFAGDSPGGS